MDIRADAGRRVAVLGEPTDALALPEFGLACTLADLYR